MQEAVIFYGLVVEPGTVARFPLQSADHAELGSATTGEKIFVSLNLQEGGLHGRAHQVI